MGDVRGKRLMMYIENVADRETKELLSPENRVGAGIADHCQKRGVIIRPLRHLNVMSPPLTITRAQVDRLVETVPTRYHRYDGRSRAPGPLEQLNRLALPAFRLADRQ